MQAYTLDTEHLFAYSMRDALADFARVNFNLFSKDTILIGAIFGSLYGVAKQIDEPIHAAFYDGILHKNLFDIGCCSKPFVEGAGLALPVLALATGCLLSDDPNNKVTGSVFLSGLIALGSVKEFIKATLEHPVCYRPYNGLFKKKCVRGGFPSGHAATLMFMTTLFGLRKGAKWAVPLGIYSGVVIGLLVGCNYHYVSQLVAGMGLGAAYAVAAHHAAQQRLHDWDFNLGLSKNGSPVFGVSYSF